MSKRVSDKWIIEKLEEHDRMIKDILKLLKEIKKEVKEGGVVGFDGELRISLAQFPEE